LGSLPVGDGVEHRQQVGLVALGVRLFEQAQ